MYHIVRFSCHRSWTSELRSINCRTAHVPSIASSPATRLEFESKNVSGMFACGSGQRMFTMQRTFGMQTLKGTHSVATAMTVRAISEFSASVNYTNDHQAMIPPPPSVCYVNWADGMPATDRESPSQPHSIFCNRTLDLSSVTTIGFDMVRLPLNIKRPTP